MKVATKTLKRGIKRWCFTNYTNATWYFGCIFIDWKRIIQGRTRIIQSKTRIKKKSLTPFHPLTNVEIIKYFKDEPRFNGVYSGDNLPKLKKRAYIVTLDHSKNTGTHWVVIFVKKVK